MKKIKKNLVDKNDEIGFGIVFDQHYTDSLLRLIQNPSKRYKNTFLKTRRSLHKKDILTSLLLFGKAYLSTPYWYRQVKSSALKFLFEEELLEWLPNEYNFQAFLKIGEIAENFWAKNRHLCEVFEKF